MDQISSDKDNETSTYLHIGMSILSISSHDFPFDLTQNTSHQYK